LADPAIDGGGVLRLGWRMDDPRVAVHSLSRRGPDQVLFGKPVKAMAAHVSRRMRPQDAFRATLSDCLAQITANAASLRPENSKEGHSAEGLHQLRVAFRRLEVALGVFGREFRQGWLEDLRGRAKILSGRLALARDLDVFVDKLLAAPPPGLGVGLDQLRARAQAARDVAWTAASACIASPQFEMFSDDVAALAASQLPLTRGTRLPKTAARMLDRQVRRVKKRGRIAASKDEGDLHRLRIALKKLRYTAEFFAPLYPKREVKRYLGKVRGLQNHLGDLNDVANVRAVVADLLRDGRKKDEDGGMRFAAGAVMGWYGAQTPRAIKSALQRYRKFRKVTPFWK
jgi:triphosphatase